MRERLFPSFFLGGFECSSHRRRDGRRLDLVAGTRHDEFAAEDYRRLHSVGMAAARDGVRWHLIEPSPGRYEFGSLLPMLRAARETGTTVVWDLFHYGWPDGLDIFSPAFVDRFAAFARAVAGVLRDETDGVPMVCPVNEPSFVAWGGGDVEYLNPFCRGRGNELKAQLVRAALAATEAVWDVVPRARVCHIDPIIHITAAPHRPQDREPAEAYRRSMFEVWDMISGRLRPELGGHPRYLDVVGVNYYWNNQWSHNGLALSLFDPIYRPVADILQEVHGRYGRPLFVAETGIENDKRAVWLTHIADEVAAALERGVPIEGVCLYPVVNHPGWDDDRHCHNGLWDYADDRGRRPVHQPLAEELGRQSERIRRVLRQTSAPVGDSLCMAGGA